MQNLIKAFEIYAVWEWCDTIFYSDREDKQYNPTQVEDKKGNKPVKEK